MSAKQIQKYAEIVDVLKCIQASKKQHKPLSQIKPSPVGIRFETMKLKATAELRDSLIHTCKKADVKNHIKKSIRPFISKDKIKGNKVGMMSGIGWGGLSVGRGFYKPAAKQAQENLAKQLFKHRYYWDNDNVLETLASFITINFSHSKDRSEIDLTNDEDAKSLLHRDTGDQSDTMLYLYQDPDTPAEHRAWWYCESEDGSIGIVPLARKNGYCCVFNGRRHLHGVIPPAKYNKDYPWFGATLLCKNKRKFYDAMCDLYKLTNTMKLIGLIENWRHNYSDRESLSDESDDDSDDSDEEFSISPSPSI